MSFSLFNPIDRHILGNNPSDGAGLIGKIMEDGTHDDEIHHYYHENAPLTNVEGNT
jgi:hypothetical protein